MRRKKRNGNISRFRKYTIIFIRFNPDKYDNNKSCFYFYDHKLKIHKKEFEKRKNKLIEVLNYWINYNNIPEKEINKFFLFY